MGDVRFLRLLERVHSAADRAAAIRSPRLRESEARKTGMLQAAIDAVVTIDEASLVLEFNPAAERMFGYTREEILGRDLYDTIVPEGYRERHRRGMARYRATGEGPHPRQAARAPCAPQGREPHPRRALHRARPGRGPDALHERDAGRDDAAPRGGGACASRGHRRLVGGCDHRQDARWDDHELEPRRRAALRVHARRGDREPDHDDRPAATSRRDIGDPGASAPRRARRRVGDAAAREGRAHRRRGLDVSPIRGLDGELVGASAVARDITRRKRIERALREEEARMRLAVESTGLGMWEWGPDTGELVFSARSRELHGFRDDAEVTLDAALARLDADDRARVSDGMRRAFSAEGPSTYRIDYRVTRPDGVVRWIRSSATALREDERWKLFGTHLDITPRHRPL